MKKMVLLMVMAGLVCWLPGQALADLVVPSITINDLGEGSPVVITNRPDFIITCNEFASVSGFVSGLGTFSEMTEMLEPGSRTVSDFAILTSVGGLFNLTFWSDGATGFDAALFVNSLIYRDPYKVPETGGFQSLFPDVTCLSIQAASDAAPVPLPPTALLLGSGLLGLVGLGWRRKKTQ